MRIIFFFVICVAAAGAAALDARSNGKERYEIYQNGVFGLLLAASACGIFAFGFW